MQPLPHFRLQLYRNFKAIASKDPYGAVRYYEQHEAAIQTLDFDACFDCTIGYTEALFVTGQYAKHVVMCQHVLELIIAHNVDAWAGEDYYQKTLHHKAVSHIRLHEQAQAIQALRALRKLYPGERLFARLLRQCLLHQRPTWLLRARARFVGAVLLAALLIAVEIFVLPFFPDCLKPARILHNIILVAAVGHLLYCEGKHFIRCTRAA